MSLAIHASGLVKRFAGMDHPALDHVDLDMTEGEMLAITGPSGSGKSTALYAMAGLITLDAGQVTLLGEAPKTRAAWADVRARRIGLVFQEDWLLPTLTACQNVELPMIGVETSPTKRKERAEAALASVGMAGHAGRAPAGLSGGERQRVALARALANRPDLILADEPTGELDRANSDRVIGLLKDLNRAGTSIVIVTHDPHVAEACSREVRITDGRLEAVR
ncbi:ABC transporter ATP-binding protein [Maritimibacter dapengensis]|uniref:ABC transporter ATP-binding protein n=1 Tax=Maritimibacter dapengensis TaxID=2836868 RepID=A0ABS6SXF7_9RHOB|nr:ABC transporter ATP-binding protein [Maritimibacter dapengensis]MBV7377649.1 ABC transporter ATP-binding protein [Maritimibacter dapengensis]